MTENVKARAVAKRFNPDEEASKTEVDGLGNALVSAVVRHQIDITSVLGANIEHGPCDMIMFSADTNANIILAEDTADAGAQPYLGKVWHPVAAKQVVAVSGGVSVWAGWYRKPPEA